MSKQIYIVISQTGTALSRLLKLITKAEYNHASISLVPDLHTMYSFGRLRPYNPFLGGFVAESTQWGTFRRFSDAKVAVMSIHVSEEQYSVIRTRIDAMLAEKEQYRYNYLGLVLAGLHIHYRKGNRYYCSEFVKDMLERSDVPGVEQLSPIVQPIHFLTFPCAQMIYSGKLAEYKNTYAHPHI